MTTELVAGLSSNPPFFVEGSRTDPPDGIVTRQDASDYECLSLCKAHVLVCLFGKHKLADEDVCFARTLSGNVTKTLENAG